MKRLWLCASQIIHFQVTSAVSARRLHFLSRRVCLPTLVSAQISAHTELISGYTVPTGERTGRARTRWNASIQGVIPARLRSWAAWGRSSKPGTCVHLFNGVRAAAASLGPCGDEMSYCTEAVEAAMPVHSERRRGLSGALCGEAVATQQTHKAQRTSSEKGFLQGCRASPFALGGHSIEMTAGLCQAVGLTFPKVRTQQRGSAC